MPAPQSLLEGVDHPGWREAMPAVTIQGLLAARADSTCPVVFLDAQGEAETLSWGQVARRAFMAAAYLRDRGVRPGDRVVLMLPTGPGYLSAFFGAIALGAVPVPVYPPMSAKQLKAFSQTLSGILLDSGATALIYWKDVKDVLGPALAAAPNVRHVLDIDAFPAGEAASPGYEAAPGDTAFIQYTSGSTAQPKGVELSHDNLLHNLDGITRGLALRAGMDKVVSWLPLYHDMGLIGTMLGALYSHIDIILMAPTTFLKRPKLWLEAIQRYGATITVAPNFAYSLCTARLSEKDTAGLDLSSLRVAMCGAEPIRLETYAAFLARFGPQGFGETVFLPVYGLAESTVASTFPAIGQAPLCTWVDREALEAEGVAQPAEPDSPRAMPALGLGRPFADSRLRVVDPATGELVPEGHVGEVQLQGPSVMKGYFRAPERTAEVVRDGWLATGDMGFVQGGQLFVTGRQKDLIIRHGRNYYPQDLEAVVESHEGVRKGCVIAFGTASGERAGEMVVVLAETRLTDPAEREALARRLKEALLARVGLKPDRLELLAPHTLLKTSSGKLRRKPTQAAYLAGMLQPRQDSWLDTVSIVARSRLHWGKRLLGEWTGLR